MGLVAVVVPAYNAAATLAETLESISEQDWRELDIVVVDDGSTDGTLAVAERHARLDRRLRIVRQSNGGASQARNLGIRNSGGAFVAPCDADDIWHRERISRLLDRMHELGPETGFVYSLSRTIDASGRVTGSIGIPGFEGTVYLRSLALNFVGNGSAALFRRAALDDVGGYEPRLRNCDDWHLQVLVARGWKVGFVPSFLTGYRLADQGKSSDPLRMKQASLVALEMIIERHPETPEWVQAAARSTRAIRLAVEKLRRGMLLSATGDLLCGFRQSPRVAIETLLLAEMPRLAAKLHNALSSRRQIEPGPIFHDVDPDAILDPVPRPKLRRLVEDLARDEGRLVGSGHAAFLRSPAGLEGRDGARGAPCP